MKITLKQAVDFHGHLGPYLVLGLLMGDFALRKLKARSYFGLEAYVWGADNRPESCLVDGLQLSCGCTYGKGNIIKKSKVTLLRMQESQKSKSKKNQNESVKARFLNCDNGKNIVLILNDEIIKKIKEAKTDKDCELLARKIFKFKPEEVFKWQCQD